MLKISIFFSQENDLLRDIFDLGPQVKPTEVHKVSRYQRVSVEAILQSWLINHLLLQANVPVS